MNHSHHAPQAAVRRLQSQNARLVPIGDRLQSEASRMAEFILEQPIQSLIPYEVLMAALGARSASEAWTEVRRGG